MHLIAYLKISFILGAAVSVTVLILGQFEAKWLIYALFVYPFLTVLIFINDRKRFLWALFVLSFQIMVSFRILHGHAESSGLVFPLVFITGLMLVTWYWLSGEIKRIRPIRLGGPLAIPISLIFATSMFSLIFTSEQFVGLIALFTLLQFYFIYLIGLNLVASMSQFDRIVNLLIIVLTLQSVLLVVQALLGFTFTLTGETFERGVRAGGTVGTNSAAFAGFILPILFIAIAHFASKAASQKERLYLAIPITVGMIALILTLRRGAWGGFAFGFIWLFLLDYRRKALSRVLKASAASLIAAVLIGTPAIVTLSDKFRTANPLSEAFAERVNLMKIALEIIKSHPLTGIGPGAYQYSYRPYVTFELMEGWMFSVHNAYLLIAAETGILGGIALVLFLLGGIRLCARVARSSDPTMQATGLGLSAGIVAFSFAIFWEPSVGYAANALLWFLIGLMGAADVLRQRSEHGGKQLQ